MEYQRVTKAVQKGQSQTPSSSLSQTSLNHVAVHPLLELQRTIGNQAVLNLLRSQNTHIDASTQAFREPRFGHDFSRIPIHSTQTAALQTELQVNQPGDIHEQEADQVAEQVMRMTDSEHSPSDEEDEAKDSLMRKQSGELRTHGANDSSSVPPVVYDVLNDGRGQPLDTTTRTFMEPRFGHDFSKVSVHTGSQAAESAKAMNALAYTVGQDIVFGKGQYTPETTIGQRLLAHELTHVIQQHPGVPTHLMLRPHLSIPADPAEIEADAIASAVVSKGPIGERIMPRRQTMMPIHSLIRPGLVQREQERPGQSPEDQAKKTLRDKFKLGRIREEHGTKWSLDDLRKVEDAFSKMSPAEQASLKGVELIRTDKMSRKYKGIREEIAGRFDPGEPASIRVANSAYKSDGEEFSAVSEKTQDVPRSIHIILHEAGHAIRAKVVDEAEAKFQTSEVISDVNKARRKVGAIPSYSFNPPPTERDKHLMAFSSAIKGFTDAASNYEYSGREDRAKNLKVLNNAKANCENERVVVESLHREDPIGKDLLRHYELRSDWVKAVEREVTEKAKIVGSKQRLESFVRVVKQNKIEPIGDYATRHWSDEPEEFFAVAYELWRTHSKELETKERKPLKDWFENGEHLK